MELTGDVYNRDLLFFLIVTFQSYLSLNYI